MFAVVTVLLFGLIGNLMLLSSHYWLPMLLKRDTEPPESYIWGTILGILLPFLAWLGFWWAFYSPTIRVSVVITAFPALVGLAGLGTITAYILDRRHSRRLQSALQQSRRQRLADLLGSGTADADALAEIQAELGDESEDSRRG